MRSTTSHQCKLR
ncbi:hypothetical protein LINPERHAP2_LOCUS3756 [Linum perenne]